MKKLLKRDDFRNAVFDRDGHKCVFCGETTNLDAHHIVERRLFSEECELGGYFVDNGATVCQEHHLACEMTTISCEEVREAAGITKVILPEAFYADHLYTKWGDVIIQTGSSEKRMKGSLFYDESVQKILAKGGVLDLYTKYVKYPRTYHHPLSKCVAHDDKINYGIKNALTDQEVVITIKMDGENFTGYNDYCHARSIDSADHESRSWAKSFHYREVAYNLPEDFRYCAENLYAKHAIHYEQLESYLLGFQIWDKDSCLSWDDTLEWFELLGIKPVEEVYRGVYDEAIIKSLFEQAVADGHEGIVVRKADSFKYKDFKDSTCKLVKEDFVADGSRHWRFKRMVVNGLKE